jgi:hypothetical protein
MVKAVFTALHSRETAKSSSEGEARWAKVVSFKPVVPMRRSMDLSVVGCLVQVCECDCWVNLGVR